MVKLFEELVLIPKEKYNRMAIDNYPHFKSENVSHSGQGNFRDVNNFKIFGGKVEIGEGGLNSREEPYSQKKNFDQKQIQESNIKFGALKNPEKKSYTYPHMPNQSQPHIQHIQTFVPPQTYQTTPQNVILPQTTTYQVETSKKDPKKGKSVSSQADFQNVKNSSQSQETQYEAQQGDNMQQYQLQQHNMWQQQHQQQGDIAQEQQNLTIPAIPTQENVGESQNLLHGQQSEPMQLEQDFPLVPLGDRRVSSQEDQTNNGGMAEGQVVPVRSSSVVPVGMEVEDGDRAGGQSRDLVMRGSNMRRRLRSQLTLPSNFRNMISYRRPNNSYPLQVARQGNFQTHYTNLRTLQNQNGNTPQIQYPTQHLAIENNPSQIMPLQYENESMPMIENFAEERGALPLTYQGDNSQRAITYHQNQPSQLSIQQDQQETQLSQPQLLGPQNVPALEYIPSPEPLPTTNSRTTKKEKNVKKKKTLETSALEGGVKKKKKSSALTVSGGALGGLSERKSKHSRGSGREEEMKKEVKNRLETLKGNSKKSSQNTNSKNLKKYRMSGQARKRNSEYIRQDDEDSETESSIPRKSKLITVKKKKGKKADEGVPLSEWF